MIEIVYSNLHDASFTCFLSFTFLLNFIEYDFYYFLIYWLVSVCVDLWVRELITCCGNKASFHIQSRGILSCNYIIFGQAIGWYVHNLLFLECLWHTVCFYFSCSLYIFYLLSKVFPINYRRLETIIERVVKYSSSLFEIALRILKNDFRT
jgi:hypothetical protein